MGEPHNEGLSCLHLLLPLHDGEHELLLGIFSQADISPVTNVSPHDPRLLGLGKSPEHVEAIHLQAMASLSLEIGPSPLIEELGLDLLIDIKPDQVLVLVVLMHEVHCVSVPPSEGVSLSLCSVITHHLHELLDALFEVFHVFGAVLDFLKGVLSSHVKCLGQDLEEKLGGEESYMRLVGSDNLLALVIHAIDVVLIAIVQLIHLSDEVVSFIGKTAKIILEPALLALRIQSSLPQSFKLVIEIS